MNRHPMRLVLMVVILAGPAAHASDGTAAFEGASYEACGLIASQYLTSVQLMQEGLEPELLKRTLPGLSESGGRRITRLHQTLSETGAEETYSNIHARFARCARNVHEQRGKPEPGSREDLFYRCAGENKIRYEVALAAFAGGRMQEVRKQLAPRHKAVAEALFQRYRETDATTVLSDIGTTFKACLRKPGTSPGTNND